MDDSIDKVGKAKYVTKFDLLKGFWQVPLTDRTKEISAFATPDGLYQYKFMPFRMKNSPASFQCLINKVTADLEDCEAYIDDVIIYSDTWEEHLRIWEIFKRLSRAMLTINLSKKQLHRWSLMLQEYVLEISHIKGKDNVTADCLSRVSLLQESLKNFLFLKGEGLVESINNWELNETYL